MGAQDIIVLAIVAGCAVLVLRKLLHPLLRSTRSSDTCGGCSSRCNEQTRSECGPEPDQEPNLKKLRL